MTNLIKPFKKLTSSEETLSITIITLMIFGVWSTSTSDYIPTPLEIIGAFPKLLEKDIVGGFFKSLEFCFTSMMYGIYIAIILAYMSVLPIFRTFCQFMRKFRFLPSAGLSFLFMKMTDTLDQQMSWMMIFGITTWLIDSMVGVALSITDDEVMYARSLRMTRWQTLKELLILGKAADMFQAVISNFAMAWMLLATIENMAKGSGGIGVTLAESSKYYRYDEVYAIQGLILLVGIGLDFGLNGLRKKLFTYTSIK